MIEGRGHGSTFWLLVCRDVEQRECCGLRGDLAGWRNLVSALFLGGCDGWRRLGISTGCVGVWRWGNMDRAAVVAWQQRDSAVVMRIIRRVPPNRGKRSRAADQPAFCGGRPGLPTCLAEIRRRFSTAERDRRGSGSGRCPGPRGKPPQARWFGDFWPHDGSGADRLELQEQIVGSERRRRRGVADCPPCPRYRHSSHPGGRRPGRRWIPRAAR